MTDFNQEVFGHLTERSVKTAAMNDHNHDMDRHWHLTCPACNPGYPIPAHTSGPWALNQTTLGGRLIGWHITAKSAGSSDPIASDLSDTQRPAEEELANAKLIASAPWLLAECQSARRILQALFDSGMEWYDDMQGDHRSIEAAICSLDAAIEKATS